jgi:hypothetical protein
MAVIHYLFLGHFEHDGEIVRFSKSSSDSVYRPVVRRPIDPATIHSVLSEVTGAEVDNFKFPDGWMTWLEDGYVVCDKYTRNQEVIDFVTRLVTRTHCDLHDVGAHCDITLRDWLAAIHTCAKP